MPPSICACSVLKQQSLHSVPCESLPSSLGPSLLQASSSPSFLEPPLTSQYCSLTCTPTTLLKLSQKWLPLHVQEKFSREIHKEEIFCFFFTILSCLNFLTKYMLTALGGARPVHLTWPCCSSSQKRLPLLLVLLKLLFKHLTHF